MMTSTRTSRLYLQLFVCLAMIAVLGVLQYGPVKKRVVVLHQDLVQPFFSGFTRTVVDPGQAKDIIKPWTLANPSYSAATCTRQLEPEDQPRLSVSVTLVVYVAPGVDVMHSLVVILDSLLWPLDLDVIIMMDGVEMWEHVDKVRTEVSGVKGVKVKQADSPGRVMAQAQGAAEAVGSILVFIDAEVTPSKGWLEELVLVVLEKPSAFFLPHLDDLDDTYSTYTPVDETRVVTFSPEAFEVILQPAKSIEIMASSPGLTGSVFAVKRSYLTSLGGFRLDLEEASHLELALRAWNCRGGVFVMPCSRVAVPSSSVQITVSTPLWLCIASMWLPQQLPALQGETLLHPEALTRGAKAKADIVSYAGTCDAPSSDLEMTLQGFNSSKIKAPTGLAIENDRILGKGTCIRVNGTRLLVEFEIKCQYTENYMFSFKNGILRAAGGKCIGAKNKFVVEMQDCVPDQKAQQWTFTEDKAIKNVHGLCFQHVSYPGDGAQAIMTQWCKGNGHQFFEFESERHFF